MSSPATVEGIRKRSFLRLPVAIDAARLLDEYKSVPSDVWASTHWDVHCSSNMILLRGGNQGNEADFYGADHIDHEVLASLPYISWLIGDSGPFGSASHAFILRMKPLGVSRPHIDSNPAWTEPFRLHVPIITNDQAYFLSEGRSRHFPVGEVWTFDNQSEHAVTNGAAVRAHLIFDVMPGPKLRDLLARAEFDPGTADPEHWNAARLPDTVPTFPYVESEPITTQEKLDLGLDVESFASRIVAIRPIARLTRADLRVGDVICRVSGVSECAVARTASDYIQVRHRPKQVLALDIVRQGAPRTVRVRLFGNQRLGRILDVKRKLTGAKPRSTPQASAG